MVIRWHVLYHIPTWCASGVTASGSAATLPFQCSYPGVSVLLPSGFSSATLRLQYCYPPATPLLPHRRRSAKDKRHCTCPTRSPVLQVQCNRQIAPKALITYIATCNKERAHTHVRAVYWRRLWRLGQNHFQKVEDFFNGWTRWSATMHLSKCMVQLGHLHSWTSQIPWFNFRKCMVPLPHFHPSNFKPLNRPSENPGCLCSVCHAHQTSANRHRCGLLSCGTNRPSAKTA